MTPTLRTPELDQAIIDGLSDGIPLTQLCRANGIGRRTVYDWIDADPVFAAAFARARSEGFDAIADGTMDIADDRDEEPASRKVRIETRLKLLAKWDPKRYGERTLVGSDPDNPLPAMPTRIELIAVAPTSEPE